MYLYTKHALQYLDTERAKGRQRQPEPEKDSQKRK